MPTFNLLTPSPKRRGRVEVQKIDLSSSPEVIEDSKAPSQASGAPEATGTKGGEASSAPEATVAEGGQASRAVEATGTKGGEASSAPEATVAEGGQASRAVEVTAAEGDEASRADEATEDILVNVDGDNLIGAGFLEDVCQQFLDGCAVAQYEMGGGTCGRIAVRREVFTDIAGYDEDAYPMGAQDWDLILRVTMLDKGRHKQVRQPTLSQAILNSQVQKIENCILQDGITRWGQMDVRNQAIFNARRKKGEIIRNQEKGWIGVPVKQWMLGSDGELKTIERREKNIRVPKPPGGKHRSSAEKWLAAGSIA